MTLEALRKDMVAAMKAKDKTTKEAVSSLVSAVKKAAIDEGCREDVPEALVDRVILKELKTVKEQLDTCPESRDDLRAEYQARYDVISKYAPQQMSVEEIRAYLEEKFAEVLATKNKGQIMKAVMGDLKGKADGKLINQVVADICCHTKPFDGILFFKGISTVEIPVIVLVKPCHAGGHCIPVTHLLRVLLYKLTHAFPCKIIFLSDVFKQA